jgi:hypothetical protein
VRSPLQANRGQAGLLQRLPPETPETPVLNSLHFFFFLNTISGSNAVKKF